MIVVPPPGNRSPPDDEPPPVADSGPGLDPLPEAGSPRAPVPVMDCELEPFPGSLLAVGSPSALLAPAVEGAVLDGRLRQGRLLGTCWRAMRASTWARSWRIRRQRRDLLVWAEHTRLATERRLRPSTSAERARACVLAATATACGAWLAVAVASPPEQARMLNIAVVTTRRRPDIGVRCIRTLSGAGLSHGDPLALRPRLATGVPLSCVLVDAFPSLHERIGLW